MGLDATVIVGKIPLKLIKASLYISDLMMSAVLELVNVSNGNRNGAKYPFTPISALGILCV